MVRNGVTFPARPASMQIDLAQAGPPRATATFGNFGSFQTFGRFFFSELWGGEPITITCSNLNPARIYLVQVMHGEPRSCCASTFFNNYFLTSANATIPVPTFIFGNGIAR
ncbi:MAG: hypothetical protein QM813_04245 [Verrucomicrobiota bacterium]